MAATLIVPDLDSISEFRILRTISMRNTELLGRIVNVVTKSGTNQLHGEAFNFLRNTALGREEFFDPNGGDLPSKPVRRHPGRNRLRRARYFSSLTTKERARPRGFPPGISLSLRIPSARAIS